MNEPDLFGPLLEPPTGGLERLRRSMAQRRRVPRFHGRYWLSAGLAMSVVVLIAVSMLIWGRGTNREEQIHEAIQQALAPSAKTYFTNAGYKEIQTGDSNVRILVVASLKKDTQ